MLNALKDNIYNTSRGIIFSIIYPAPSIFSPRTRNYIGVRGLINLIPNLDRSRHLLHLDLEGNLCTPNTSETVMPSNVFEIILIKNPDDTSLYNDSIQYIIFIGGNTTCMEILLPEMLECYNNNNKNVCVIGYNPPGVGLSPGVATFETNCAAPEAIVKHLLAHNIPAQNILIIGHSIGGSFGSHVAVKHRTRLFIDRAMSSISDAAVAKILRAIPTLLLRNTIGVLLALITKLIIKTLSLEIDLVKNLVTLNTDKHGSVRVMAAEGDEMMQQCCLMDKLPADQADCAVKFALAPDDKNRKSHSVQRQLLFSKFNLDRTAAKYLANFINEFSKHNNRSHASLANLSQPL
jgi:pimeloyl-ACP methyl ester carboxylesterase